ncbi:MAG TPA: MOSC domain-containing protein [bacterium]|nr:MOSC domain-containing protein [bacterium]
MRLVAVSVGLPREVRDEKRGVVRTGIWKVPVEGPVRVGRVNLAGDGQADLVNHGGEHKAVYAYPIEHYPRWRRELGRDDLAPGGFGENLTTEGLLESAVGIGDRFRIGSAVLEASQPRTPCFKLGLRLGDPGIVKRFLASGRCGIYFRVVEEGELTAEAAIERIAYGAGGMTVAEVNWLMHWAPNDRAGAARAAALEALAPDWRAEFAARVGPPPADAAPLRGAAK